MASSYFSEPEQELDPALFSGWEMYPDVNAKLLELVQRDLRLIGLRSPEDWATAWVAGSGVSFQWSADRGNGDLDVLFGVDYPRFLSTNPNFPRLGIPEVARYVDSLLKENAWPKTAHYSIHGKFFEVTVFWNAEVSKDIRVIHPYAAWNLNARAWDVYPDQHPVHDFPDTWQAYADFDLQEAQRLDKMIHKGPSSKVDAQRMARSMWTSLHEGRRFAFGEQGSGYNDVHNARWQMGKQSGAVDILRRLVGESEPENPVDEPADIITRAAIRYSRPEYVGRGRG